MKTSKIYKMTTVDENDNFVQWVSINMPNLSEDEKRKVYQAWILTVLNQGLLLRRDGTSVMNHLESTAKRLHRWDFDLDFFIAGLLHDLIEDCPVIKLEAIKKEFGEDVARMIDFMSKNIMYGIISYKSKVDHFLKEHPNYIFIRLADQFHNISNPIYRSYESFLENCREIKENLKIASIIIENDLELNNNKKLKTDLSGLSQIVNNNLETKS